MYQDIKMQKAAGNCGFLHYELSELLNFICPCFCPGVRTILLIGKTIRYDAIELQRC